jgi:hypothetical protein
MVPCNKEDFAVAEDDCPLSPNGARALGTIQTMLPDDGQIRIKAKIDDFTIA